MMMELSSPSLLAGIGFLFTAFLLIAGCKKKKQELKVGGLNPERNGPIVVPIAVKPGAMAPKLGASSPTGQVAVGKSKKKGVTEKPVSKDKGKPRSKNVKAAKEERGKKEKKMKKKEGEKKEAPKKTADPKLVLKSDPTPLGSILQSMPLLVAPPPKSRTTGQEAGSKYSGASTKKSGLDDDQSYPSLETQTKLSNKSVKSDKVSFKKDYAIEQNEDDGMLASIKSKTDVAGGAKYPTTAKTASLTTLIGNSTTESSKKTLNGQSFESDANTTGSNGSTSSGPAYSTPSPLNSYVTLQKGTGKEDDISSSKLSTKLTTGSKSAAPLSKKSSMKEEGSGEKSTPSKISANNSSERSTPDGKSATLDDEEDEDENDAKAVKRKSTASKTTAGPSKEKEKERSNLRK